MSRIASTTGEGADAGAINLTLPDDLRNQIAQQRDEILVLRGLLAGASLQCDLWQRKVTISAGKAAFQAATVARPTQETSGMSVAQWIIDIPQKWRRLFIFRCR